MGFFSGLFGEKNGPVEKYHSNGQLMVRGTYKNGVYHGPYQIYYENGQLSEDGICKDGKLHGPYENYFSHGQLQEKGTYKDGERHGVRELYHADGQVDDAEAVRWYRLAAEQGYAPAQYGLGLMYYRGEGSPEDEVLAYMWWNLAAARWKGISVEGLHQLNREEVVRLWAANSWA